MTHCNAGGLATSGYGTALAVMFTAHERGTTFSVYVDETRPLLQGARLTAWELMRAGIEVTVICDNMAGHLMSLGKVDLHYTAEGTYGTLLLWRAYFAEFSDEELRQIVQEIMDELSAPMGVPGEFLIECIFAAEEDDKVYSNMLDVRSDLEPPLPDP